CSVVGLLRRCVRVEGGDTGVGAASRRGRFLVRPGLDPPPAGDLEQVGILIEQFRDGLVGPRHSASLETIRLAGGLADRLSAGCAVLPGDGMLTPYRSGRMGATCPVTGRRQGARCDRVIRASSGGTG